MELPEPLRVPHEENVNTLPSVVASPQNDAAAIVFDANPCPEGCEGFMTVGAHRIVLYDVATRTPKEIAKGEGVGAVRFDPSGRMFVQQNRKVFRATKRDDPATWQALPANVLLVPPTAEGKDVHCCGD